MAKVAVEFENFTDVDGTDKIAAELTISDPNGDIDTPAGRKALDLYYTLKALLTREPSCDPYEGSALKTQLIQ